MATSAPNWRPSGPVTLYRVRFTSYDGVIYLLDTVDPNRIGPWLAEWFGLFPWNASMPTSVEIRTVERFR